jgi:hypothetical protein
MRLRESAKGFVTNYSQRLGILFARQCFATPGATSQSDPRVKIREAQLADANAACDVLRRSITELCELDHRNDPALLTKWLENKTPRNVTQWIADKNICVFVAENAGIISGVGAMTVSGVIILNYVAPDARFAGVSKGILSHLEMGRQRDLQAVYVILSLPRQLVNALRGFRQSSSRLDLVQQRSRLGGGRTSQPTNDCRF